MPTAFVTGGTGFIGMTLVEFLLGRGYNVKVLARTVPPPAVRGKIVRDAAWRADSPVEVVAANLWEHPNVNIVAGDIGDVASLESGMAGCDEVYHLAGYAKNWARDATTFHRVNVDGVLNVCNVAQRVGARRVVWTSSIVTLGASLRRPPADEDTPRRSAVFMTEYEEAKYVAEQEVARLVAGGAQVVTVNPTRVYGPGLLSESNSISTILRDYHRNFVVPFPNWGRATGNYVLVDDVARGLWLAMQNGRVGERYILGGDNASYAELFATMDRITGHYPIKFPLLKFGPKIFATALRAWCVRFGGYPFITPGWVETFFADWTHSTAKAERELGYTFTPLTHGLEKTAAWLATCER
ncbi:MAG: NAD-dependent epimerase/dehydratase family protein [Thermoguttaceae bacterium]